VLNRVQQNDKHQARKVVVPLRVVVDAVEEPSGEANAGKESNAQSAPLKMRKRYLDDKVEKENVPAI
jgi:hypothetical protein